MSAEKKSTRLVAVRVNCPHCRNPIELAPDGSVDEVVCPSCGSTFHLDRDRTQSWSPDKPPQLGKFELIEAVGRGAFGTVYRARDTQLQRTVAVKVPRSGQLATDEDEDRFAREARNAAQLHHPGIVPVYEVGHSDAFPYIVSEFVEGITLADALSAQRFGFRQSAQLVAQVAAALAHAHDQGVVHRDLKPSNIMLTPDGSPRVMDFGMAKRDAGEITMTVEGQVLGTPAYMSPEQASGQAHHVDGRSDVYALGVILFELMTGELPFRGNQRMLLHQVLHVEPRSPRSLNDRIPRDLETICLKAMGKEAPRRYPTAQAMADDLARYLAGKPIAARPVGRLERGWRWCRRNRLVAGLAAAVALTLVSGTIVSGYFAADAIVQKTLADQKTDEARASAKNESLARLKATADAQRANTEAEKAKRVAQFQASMFESSAPRQQAGFRFTGMGPRRDKESDGPANAAARELLDRGARKVVEELKDQPEMQATLMDTIGNVYIGHGLTDQAEPLLLSALAIRRKLFPEAHLDSAASLHSLATLRLIQFRTHESIEASREALAIREQLLDADHKDIADVKFLLGCGMLLGDRQDGDPVEVWRQVLAWRRHHLGNEHPETAYAMIGLGTACLSRNETAEGASLFGEATAVFVKDPETKSLGLAMTEIQQAMFLWKLGQPKAGAAMSTKALAHFREFTSDDHPLFIYFAGIHAKALVAAGQFDEAKRFCRELLQGIRQRGAPINPAVAAGIAEALAADADLRDLDEAEQLCRDCLHAFQVPGKPPSADVALVVRTLADVLAKKAKTTDPAKPPG